MASRLRHAKRLAGFLMAGALLGGCGGGGGSAVSAGDPVPWRLVATDEAGLTAYLREALGPSSVRYAGVGWDVTVGVAAAEGVPAPAVAAFSGTTLQEAGVDEADLIKSDGTHVFSLDVGTADQTRTRRDVLRRQRLDGSAADAPLVPVDGLQLPFSAGVSGAGLYLDEERRQLAVVGRAGTAWGMYDAWFSPWSWTQGATEVALVAIPASAAPQARRTLRFDGHLIGSRRIGATLYLVLRSTPQLPGFDPWWSSQRTTSNRALLDSLQAAQVLPTVSVNGGTPQPLLPPSSCLVQERNAARTPDIVTIVGIDLAGDGHAARCFVGGTEAFYMSQRHLYLATSRTSYAADGGLPAYAPETSTDIHKFALDGLAIAYRGSGNVKGHLGFDQNRKSFRLGEHDGVLRVVTQTQQQWIGIAVATAPGVAPAATATAAAIDSPARLSVLEERAGALAVVGELPNAARPQPLGKPGEQLYASRFIGTRGYLVTYRLTDPLYVLDLSDPADPKLAGELQVEGYSDYLFPVSDTLLLGVGKDAVVDGSAGDGRFAWYQGVKVSLIDVSDPARPREADRAAIGRRGSSATVLFDHHGIAFQPAGGTMRVSLPVSVHETPVPGAAGRPSDWFQFTRNELQRFEVDVAGRRLAAKPALAGTVSGQRSILYDRSLLWHEQVHWYQDGAWRSAAW